MTDKRISKIEEFIIKHGNICQVERVKLSGKKILEEEFKHLA